MLGLIRAARWDWRDACLVLSLLPVALFSVSPYVGGTLVGAGDGQHYALQVADFIAQSRAGVMPIFAGNSAYAFNGNVHTLRTAPYFTHFAGMLDGITLHRLGPVELQNLTVCCTAMLAAAAAYFAARHASGRRRLLAWLLAALYVLSPALVSPLSLNDMFATYMAAPWLVLFWFALAGLVTGRDARTFSLIGAGALAMTWYAHSPLGAWATVVAGGTLLLHLGQRRFARSDSRPLVVATCLFVGLVAYAWISVETLGNPSAPLAVPPFAEFSLSEAAMSLREALISYRAGTVADLKFGLPLGLLLLATLGLGCSRRSGLWPLVVTIALLILLLFPWPAIAEPLWRAMPDRLVVLTTWPAQRFYPLLAAATIVVSAFAWCHALRGRVAHGLLVALLVLGIVWSGWQTTLLNTRPNLAKLPPTVSAQLLAPENLPLTRYSYALFESPPPSFTHSWADPEWETRIRGPFGDVVDDNAQTTLALAPPGEFAPLIGETVLSLPGPAEYLFVFAFADSAAHGEIVFHAPGIRRAYSLPSSGEPFAFGSGPAAAKTVPLRLSRDGPNAVSVAATAAGVTFRVIPIVREKLPVRLVAQTPFTTQIRMREAGFVETPRVFLDGYAARVNGRAAPVQRSPGSLVMVPVPAGDSDLVVEYVGPPRLRVAWWLSVSCFALWPWCVLSAACRASPVPPRPAAPARRAAIFAVLATLVVLGLITAAAALRQKPAASGSLRLEVKLPAQAAYAREPLLTTGRSGAGDGVFLIYEAGGAVRIGIDHWGTGGPTSDPIFLDRSRPHTFEITLGSLYPRSRWFDRNALPTSSRRRVVVDGRVVFDQPAPAHAATADEVYLARNPIGLSGISRLFSGYIIKAERFAASPP